MADPIRIKYRESGDSIAEGIQEAPRPRVAIPVKTWLTWLLIIAVIFVLICFRNALRPGGFNGRLMLGIVGPILLLVGLFTFFVFHRLTSGASAKSVEWWRDMYRKHTGRDESTVV